jgi:hypothetical protein
VETVVVDKVHQFLQLEQQTLVEVVEVVVILEILHLMVQQVEVV